MRKLPTSLYAAAASAGLILASTGCNDSKDSDGEFSTEETDTSISPEPAPTQQWCRAAVVTKGGKKLLINHVEVACNSTTQGGESVPNTICLPLPRDLNYDHSPSPYLNHFRNDTHGIQFTQPLQTLTDMEAATMRGFPGVAQTPEQAATHQNRISISANQVGRSIPGIGFIQFCERNQSQARRAEW